MTFKHSIVLGIMVSLPIGMTLADVKTGSIGSLSSDTGPSILCGAGIAIKGINAIGGMNGEKFMLISADIGEDVTEGTKVYEYLVGTEEVDFIVSGSIDNVSPGWLSHMQEFQIPTLDTRTSHIDIVDMVVKDSETTAPYFMDIASDEALATLYINFGTDVLKKEIGWDSVVILAEDAIFGEATTGLVTEALDPVAGIETEEIITYDVGMVDFVPLFPKMQAPGAGFIYQISSVDSQVTSSQYVKLQVPMAMTGVNVSALGFEYWEDTGGAGGGISALSPIPSVGLELDPKSQRFVDTCQIKYDNRPKMPHFNGFNAYWGLEQAVTAAEAVGGFGDVKTWSAGMKEQDITLKKGGKIRLRYAFWGDDEIEGVIGRAYPHNACFDLTASYDDVQPFMVVIQWKEDGEVGVVYPPEYVTAKFTVSSWVK